MVCLRSIAAIVSAENSVGLILAPLRTPVSVMVPETPPDCTRKIQNVSPSRAACGRWRSTPTRALQRNYRRFYGVIFARTLKTSLLVGWGRSLRSRGNWRPRSPECPYRERAGGTQTSMTWRGRSPGSRGIRWRSTTPWPGTPLRYSGGTSNRLAAGPHPPDARSSGQRCSSPSLPS